MTCESCYYRQGNFCHRLKEETEMDWRCPLWLGQPIECPICRTKILPSQQVYDLDTKQMRCLNCFKK